MGTPPLMPRRGAFESKLAKAASVLRYPLHTRQGRLWFLTSGNMQSWAHTSPRTFQDVFSSNCDPGKAFWGSLLLAFLRLGSRLLVTLVHIVPKLTRPHQHIQHGLQAQTLAAINLDRSILKVILSRNLGQRMTFVSRHSMDSAISKMSKKMHRN